MTVSIDAVSSGVGVCGLPATILVRQTTLVVVHDLEREVGNIDHHVSGAEVARQPAPALHIGEHARRRCWPGLGPLMAAIVLLSMTPVGLISACCWTCLIGVEELAVVGEIVRPCRQRAAARAASARARPCAPGLIAGPSGMRSFGGFARIGWRAQFGELGLERAEALMRRIEAFERGVGVARPSAILRRMSAGSGVWFAVVDFGQHAGRRDAADLQMAGEGQHRIGELDVAVGQRLGAGEAAEFRHRIIGGIEPVGGGVLEPRDHRLGAGVEPAVADPQRRVVARGIESSRSPCGRARARCACRVAWR